MYLIITYDIQKNRQRLKIANELLNYGLQRVQKSVFEGEIKTIDFKKLKGSLKKFISKNDSIRYYVLCKDCQSKIQVIGIDFNQAQNKKTQIL